MRYLKLIILFLLFTVAANAQYFITIKWSPTPTVIGFGSLAHSTGNPLGTTYVTSFKFDSLDGWGNPVYKFVPLTPPNFTNNDIVLNNGTFSKSADSLTYAQKASQVSSLKSFAYKGLQNFTMGGTLTAAQIQEALQIYLCNQGAFNPATNKIDSTLNYIK